MSERKPYTKPTLTPFIVGRLLEEVRELKSRADESRKEAERAEARYAVLKHEFAAKLGLKADATVEEIVSELHDYVRAGLGPGSTPRRTK